MDELPPRPKKGMGIIVNMEPHTMGGSHWVCAFFDSKGGYYLDPFGVPEHETMKAWMEKYPKPIEYQSNDLQHPESSRCGMYCFYFLNELLHGKDIYDVLYRLNQVPSETNEDFIQTYWNSH